MAASMAHECEEKADWKIAVPVDDISPCIEGSICIGGEGKRHQIYAIQNGTEYVYIYENMTRKGILHLPDQCRCMCVYVSRDAVGDEHLVCGLRDGRIIQQNLQLFKDDTKSKKKKKKKDKHKSKEKPQTAVLHHQGSHEDIFGGLLEPADARPSCSHGPPPTIEEDGLSENVVILGDSHVLLNEPNIQDLIFVKGRLVTCSKCTVGWTLSVYRPEVKGQLGDTMISHHAVGKQGLEFQKSPSFRTFLPESGMESSSHHGDRTINQSGATHCLGEPIGFEAEGSGKRKKPQLFCVVSKSMCEKEDITKTTPGRSMILEDSLYNQLFGTDFNFLDTPIILISLPDGHIYFSPLRTLGITQVSRPKQVRTGSNWFGLNTSLFYVLDQPAATIHGFNTRVSLEAGQENRNTDTTLHVCDCVCIVGQYGKVVQITENNTTNQKETLKFSESHVKGPVQTICRTRTPHNLLYSTGKEIYSLSLSEASQKGSAREVQGCNASSSFVLGIGKIRAMAVVGRASKDSSFANPFVALTEDGSVLKLHPPTDGTHGNKHPPITAAAAGKRMQELLQAINSISERTGELAKLGETQDHILLEMSQACHVAGVLLSDHNSAKSSTIFAADVHCEIRNDGNACSLELLCQLTNHSKWSLSHGWSLVVSVNANPDWTKLEEDTRHHVTKSLPLVNFRPIQTVQLIFPLHHGNTMLAMPVDVQCFFHFSPEECMHSILPEKTNLKTETHFKVGECGILIPLMQQKVIDILSVLRPLSDHRHAAQGVAPYQTVRNRGCDWLASALESAASLRPSANRMGCTSSEKTGGSGSASVCISISNDVTSMILQHRKDGAYNSECNTQEQILRWLLEDNRLATHPTNPLRLLTLDAKVVTFEVKVQSSGSERREGAVKDGSKASRQGDEMVEIVITAPDCLTLCQLQLAVNRKIKMVLESVGKSRGISTSQDGLQKQLRKVQALQRKLQSLQDNMILHDCYDNQCSHNQVGTPTLELYQQMRSQLTFM
ncbi:Fanconi anemia core complex-associated protein 100-like [Patiria miniata]|uniref:Fanconi anemia core complex-associated protein 100 n=1 Tax=Patiria miniata TaxID=46514 RepID=A0A914BMQ5_PATMI|nr:Fanconi anemia core complex-associated protein 100-like [Patiria miniata]